MHSQADRSWSLQLRLLRTEDAPERRLFTRCRGYSVICLCLWVSLNASPSGHPTPPPPPRRGRSLLVVTNDNQYTLSSNSPELPTVQISPHGGGLAVANDVGLPSSRLAVAGRRVDADTNQRAMPRRLSFRTSPPAGGGGGAGAVYYGAGGGGVLGPAPLRVGSAVVGAGSSQNLGSVAGFPSQGASRDTPTAADFPLHQREQRAKTHLHSADLFDRVSTQCRVLFFFGLHTKNNRRWFIGRQGKRRRGTYHPGRRPNKMRERGE